MEFYHRMSVGFGCFPTLPDQRVVELLSGGVLPLDELPSCARDGRYLTVHSEGDL